jgi:ferrous iron transport protein A
MMALSSLKAGARGTVAAIRTDDHAIASKLFAMGISPGAVLVLEQQFPSYVVRVGRTRATFDDQIAQVIYLSPLEPS